jgi:hypothetical protein
MRLGIFAKTFSRPTAEQTLQAAADAGVAAVQFNLSVLGLRPGPFGVVALAHHAQADAGDPEAGRAGIHVLHRCRSSAPSRAQRASPLPWQATVAISRCSSATCAWNSSWYRSHSPR